MKKLTLVALALAWGLCSAKADAATVYFAGGEDTSITAIGGSSFNVGPDTDAVSYRSAYARASLRVIGNTSAADPPTYRFQTPTFTSASSLWIHAQVDLSSNSASSATGEQALLVRSPDGVSRIVVRQTATLGQLKVSTRNAAGTITDLATASSNISTNTLTALDLQIVYGCTSGDRVTLYVAGSQVINYTGASICTDAATQLNQVEFASLNTGTGSNACTSAFNSTCWSEIIIADSDTRGMALWTLAPQAAGNTQSWTPNTVSDVNPNTINDSNLVTTGSNSSLSEWTTPTSTPTGTWGVVALVQEARVLRGTTGPQNFDFLARTKDGSDHLFGYSSTVSTSFGNFNNIIWANNPHTSTSWATTDIASGFNLGIESLP